MIPPIMFGQLRGLQVGVTHSLRSRWKSEQLIKSGYSVMQRSIGSSSLVSSCDCKKQIEGKHFFQWESFVDYSCSGLQSIRNFLNHVTQQVSTGMQRKALIFVEFLFSHQTLTQKDCIYPLHSYNNSISHWVWSSPPVCEVSVLPNHDRLQVLFAVDQGFIENASANDASPSSPVMDGKLFPSQLQRLAAILECSMDDMKQLVTEYKFFLHIDPDLVRVKVAVMLSFALPLSFVRENPRIVYQTSAPELHKRLQLLKENGFLCENPVVSLDQLAHYLECNNEIFAKGFEKLCAEMDALEGCSDQLSYIQFRLQCSSSAAHALLNSYPLERHVSNVKLKRLFDFFLEEAGFSPQFVLKHRLLLAFSTVRLRSRWKVMQAAGVTSESGLEHGWSISEKKFKQEYETYMEQSDRSG